MIRKITFAPRWESYHLVSNGECDRHHCIYTSRSVYNGNKMAIMQNSINLNAHQLGMNPAGASVGEGVEALKKEVKAEVCRLWHTKSETFSHLCEETVTYGEVAMTMAGLLGFVALAAVGGFIFGGEVM